jgi:hypothetical protein
MKTEINAVVVRHKDDNRILDIIPIGDVYNEVLFEYLIDYCTPDELSEAFSDWGYRTDIVKEFEKSGRYILQNEAKDVLSVGRIAVKIETKEIDWE